MQFRLGPLLAGVFCAALSTLLMPLNPAAAQTFGVWQSWLSTLPAQGYTVTQGTAISFTTSYCQAITYPVFKTCFGNDYEDPYVVAMPPAGAGYVDPYYGAQTSIALPGGVSAAQLYHLDPTEAVLVIVNLPPVAAYFSYQTYLFTRPTNLYAKKPANLSPDKSRAQIFASFSNSINNIDIAQQTGLGFGEGQVAFITTANSALATALTDSFAANGYNPSLIFIDPMGSNLNPGLGSTTDDFISVMRYSIPMDTVAGNAWRGDLADNVQIYRIGQPAGAPVVRFGATAINSKSYNIPEMNHAAALSELSTLLQGWLASQESKTVAIVKTVTGEALNSAGMPLTGDFGPYCIANATNCSGDSQDTDTYKTASVGVLPEGRMFIVDGVDHTVTNNSTFVSLGASDQSTGTGVASAPQTNASATGFATGVLSGSASQVLHDLGLYSQASRKLVNDLPNLYVHLFTRPCNPALLFCQQYYTTALPSSSLPDGDQIKLTERAYVLPYYVNGANPSFLLNPNVIY